MDAASFFVLKFFLLNYLLYICITLIKTENMLNRLLKKYLEFCFFLGEQIACCIAFFLPISLVYYILGILF